MEDCGQQDSNIKETLQLFGGGRQRREKRPRAERARPFGLRK